MSGLFTLDNLNKEISKYTKQKIDFAGMFSFYKDIMEIVLNYKEKVRVNFDLAEENLNNCLRGGTHLSAEQNVEIDEIFFEEIRDKITEYILKKDSEQGSLLSNFWSEPGAESRKLIDVHNKSGGFTPESLESYCQENGIHEKYSDIFEIISFVVFSSLMPFYMRYAEKTSEATDYKLWSEGNCPVCGQKPMMSKIRKDDSARIMGCWLCHTEWVFPRLECPFCNNKDHQKLRFFYIDEIKGRRVNVCEKCKSYIKASSLKELGRDVILDLENLFTVELDSVAQKEGYHPGKDLYLLN